MKLAKLLHKLLTFMFKVTYKFVLNISYMQELCIRISHESKAKSKYILIEQSNNVLKQSRLLRIL